MKNQRNNRVAINRRKSKRVVDNDVGQELCGHVSRDALTDGQGILPLGALPVTILKQKHAAVREWGASGLWQGREVEDLEERCRRTVVRQFVRQDH
jgi:hypothetical protein